MNWLKKFWIVFISFLPFSAGAFAPFLIGGIAFGGGIIGMSIWRSVSPVSMSDALSFFSSWWSCQIFSDIIGTMSNIIPATYKSLGVVIIPFAIALTAIWFAWQMFTVYVTPKNGNVDGWAYAGKWGTHIIRVLFVAALLAVPSPRMISSVVLEPVFDIGLSMNYTMSVTDARENYANCIIATAIADATSINTDNQNSGINAFSPRFRHNLACQIANVHQMTGLGMTIGWTMLNMAFNHDYMHKLMWGIPIFPNIPLFLTGMLILVLYFAALLPIPLYFLEIFIKLSIDFILLPLTLLSWLFNGWKLFPSGKSNIKQTVDDVISGVMGLAMTGIFITFSIMVLNAVFGNWDGASALQSAIANNYSKILIDSLMGNIGNKSLITIVLMGIFMAMFMVMIPALIKSLFNVSISDEYYQTAKKDIDTLWKGAKKWWSAAKK